MAIINKKSPLANCRRAFSYLCLFKFYQPDTTIILYADQLPIPEFSNLLVTTLTKGSGCFDGAGVNTFGSNINYGINGIWRIIEFQNSEFYGCFKGIWTVLLHYNCGCFRCRRPFIYKCHACVFIFIADLQN